MCGRTGLSLNKNQIQCACSYKNKSTGKYNQPEWINEHNDGKEYSPSYNIAPADVTPVLISSSRHKHIAKTDRILKPMVWGIIPPWVKNDYKNHGLSTNNCRIESLTTSKLYSPILLNGGRCVIVVEGFYEWQSIVKAKEKQPYYIYAQQDASILVDNPSTWKNEFSETEGWNGVKLLHIAGLYHAWQSNEKIVYSYSVITMDSNSSFSWLHHRMPAILDSDEKIAEWLDIDNVNADTAVANLAPVQKIQWHPVSTLVNNSRKKTDTCNKRVKHKNKPQKRVTDYFFKVDKRKPIEESIESNKKQKK